MDNGSLAVQDESSRHGQSPGVIAIEPLEIDAEFRVQVTQILRQGVNQAKLGGHRVAGVSQHTEGQVVFFGHLLGKFYLLRRNPNKGGACLFDTGNNPLKSCQLFVTIRSPNTPVEADDQRSTGQ